MHAGRVSASELLATRMIKDGTKKANDLEEGKETLQRVVNGLTADNLGLRNESS